MNSRNQSLDVLRGVAVLMVLFCHYAQVLGIHSVLLDFGGCGVDLFFVLSGFLISGLLFLEYQNTGGIEMGRFLIRRGLKIYPSFYGLLGVTAVFFIIKAHSIPRVLFTDAIFLQNYLPHFWEHGWSLAVEEHFYLLLPPLLLVLIRIRGASPNPFRAIPLISIGLSIMCLFLRILALRGGTDFIHIAFPTHLRADALFAGVTLGYFAKFEPESFRQARKNWVIILGLFFTGAVIVLPDIPRLTFAYVAASFIVAWAMNRPQERKVYLSRPLAWVGRYSYSIYIWQVFAMMVLQYVSAKWFRFPLYIGFAIGFGVLMSKLIEMPVLRLRERLFPARTQVQSQGIGHSNEEAASIVTVSTN